MKFLPVSFAVTLLAYGHLASAMPTEHDNIPAPAAQTAAAPDTTAENAHIGKLYVEQQQFKCALGRHGVTADKKEGDGATPIGEFSVRKIFYRPDRVKASELKTQLPLIKLDKNDGWCDDVNLPQYNTSIKLPFNGSHEALWRDDHVYDIIVVVGYNDNPVVKGKGSAIFMHIAREGYQPTAGCIALSREDLLKILPYLTPHTKIKVDADRKVSIIS